MSMPSARKSGRAARDACLALLAWPLATASAQLSLGPGLGGASAAAGLPVQVAMAWAVSIRDPLQGIDLDSVLPDLRSCMSGLGRLDLTQPEHWAPIEPVLSELSASGLGPKEFSALGPARRQEVLVAAVSRVADSKRARAALLILRTGTGRIEDHVLESVETESHSLRRDSLFLTERLLRDVDSIARQASRQRAERERARVLSSAQETARRLGQMKEDSAADQVVRTVLAPDGRRVRLVRRGTVYQVFYEGETEALVRYDIADLDSDGIPAFTVERGGRRGLHINGRVFWEDGVY